MTCALLQRPEAFSISLSSSKTRRPSEAAGVNLPLHRTIAWQKIAWCKLRGVWI